MDELELLKQDWSKEKNNEFKIYSEDELFQMTKKKSVSVAKWVFIITLCEILFWIGLDYALSNIEKSKSTNIPHFADGFITILDTIETAMPYLFLAIIIYLNYKIRNTEEPKKLMRKILLMKNLVKWYIRIFLINIIFSTIIGFLLLTFILHQKGELASDSDKMIFLAIILIFVLFAFIIILFLRFIYHLIYGNLIYKLEKNYKELQEMETSQ